MPAYAIVQVDVKDADEYAKYAALAGPAVAQALSFALPVAERDYKIVEGV